MTTPAPQSAPRTFAFDPRALTEPVDRAEVSRFDKELKARHPGGGMSTAAFVLLIVFGVIFVGMAALMLAGTVFIALATNGGPAWNLPIVPLILVLAVVGVAVFTIVSGSREKEKRYRLARFAQANAMTYIPRLRAPRLPGMIFQQGREREAQHLLRGEHPRFVEFANYRYTTGSGKNKNTHRWGYVAIHLDAPLPHIVLDALSNNALGLSNLPSTFDKGQRLSLEGDFDRHFALYCPKGYETDALYLFTPDIMARFLDNAAQLDVEIVDDWLFLYVRRDVATTDPGSWAWLFSVVSALMDKLAQWGRWRDERLAASAAGQPAGASPVPANGAAAALPFAQPGFMTPPKGVAQQGRRLRKGVPWAGVIVAAVIVGFWLVQAVGQGAFGFLLSR